MPLDTNFAVVTVILGGLLIWSMTQKADAPPAEIDPRKYSPPFDGPVDMDIEDVVGKKPDKDARAPQLMQHIRNIVDYLTKQKTKFDVMMRDLSGTATIADLERKHGQVANEIRYTIAQCSNWSSDFIMWRRALEERASGCGRTWRNSTFPTTCEATWRPTKGRSRKTTTNTTR